MHEPRRKPHRLPELFYHGRQIYFLTLCTHGRKKVFTDPELVPHLIEVLREKCQTQAYSVYAFCFMPDHMHVVVVGMDDSAALSRAIRAFKGASVARARALGVSSLWQKGFYDHVVRTGEGADRGRGTCS